MSRRANGVTELAVAGREAEIFALLSLAQGRAIHPNVLHGLHGVAKCVACGDAVGAAIRLAQLRLPPLRGPRDSELLKTGATFLAKGVSPWTILQEAGIGGHNVGLFKADFDESLHPRDPATGRFIASGAVAFAPSLATPWAPGAATIALDAALPAAAAILPLAVAGAVISLGPKGSIEDGASYWLPGVSNQDASGDDDGAPSETPEDAKDESSNNSQRPSKTPNSGYPGSTFKNPGSGQERTYGPDGKPLKDIDFDHDHGQGVPHQHDWVGGVRGRGKSIK